MTCRFPNCSQDVEAKNYCGLHYAWLRKGWLDPATNQPTASCRGRVKYDKCRVPSCYNDHELKIGFCPKHYKRYKKGCIAEDGTVLVAVRKRYRPDETCKVSGCQGKPRRWGFCPRHSGSYLEGRLNEKGEPHPLYIRKKRRYGRDYCCIACGLKGARRYILGFCRACHLKYERGILDFDGNNLRPLKRIPKYPEGATCKIPGCDDAARVRWMCENHALQVKRGTLSEKGEKLLMLSVNKGKKCLVCEEPARIKGYCQLHYTRLKSSGVPYLNHRDNPNWKNLGKKCSVELCNGHARSLGLCGKHYFRHTQKSKGLTRI